MMPQAEEEMANLARRCANKKSRAGGAAILILPDRHGAHSILTLGTDYSREKRYFLRIVNLPFATMVV